MLIVTFVQLLVPSADSRFPAENVCNSWYGQVASARPASTAPVYLNVYSEHRNQMTKCDFNFQKLAIDGEKSYFKFGLNTSRLYNIYNDMRDNSLVK